MVDAYSLAFTTIGGSIYAIPTSPSFVSIESLGADNDVWVDKLLPQWVFQRALLEGMLGNKLGQEGMLSGVMVQGQGWMLLALALLINNISFLGGHSITRALKVDFLSTEIGHLINVPHIGKGPHIDFLHEIPT
jgi:hypothetical protein